MTSAPLLIGSWVPLAKGTSISASPPECIWHVVDDSTCVYEQQTEMGLMISWFQYWIHEEGILRYPLCENTRAMYKSGAEYVPLALEASYLTMHGCRFDRVSGLPVPDRVDIFPGTRPDENGIPVPHFFRGNLCDPLPEPPKGEQSSV